MASKPTVAAVPSAAMAETETRIALRAKEEEIAMLRALAERDGVSSSDVVRTLIRRAYREAFGDSPPKKTPKK